MKTRIIIEFETIKMKDFFDKPNGKGDNITKFIEKALHDAVFDYINDFVTSDEFDIGLYDGYTDKHDFGIEDFESLADYGKIKITIEKEEPKVLK